MKKFFIAIALILLATEINALTLTSDVNGQVIIPNQQLTIGEKAPQVTLYNGDYKKVKIGGELTGITARSVFVINKKGKIVYKDITHNIDKMPNMVAAIDAIKKANEQ